MIAAWMLYAVAVSVPVALGTAGCAWLLRRHGLAERGIWVVGLAVALGLPALEVIPPTWFGPAPAPAGVIALDLGLPDEIVVAETGWLARAAGAALWLWVALSTVLAVRVAGSVRRLWRARRAWAPERRAGVDVLVSDDVGPAVFGVLRPRVVLPRWMSELPADQLDLIVRHEQEHIRARDPLLLGTVLALRVALPWHPGVWYLTAGLREALEIDCDRRVLVGRRDVGRYGETVLQVAARMRPGPRQPVAAFTEPIRFIQRRLLTMTIPRRALGRLGVLGLFLFAALVLVGACEMPLPSFSNDAEIEPVVEPDPELVIPEGQQLIVPRMPEGEGPPKLPPPPAEERDIEEAPTFTPFTVAPGLLNRDEIVRAMEREYPPLLRDAGIGGTVRVYFFLDEEGTVKDRRVDQSSGHPALDDAALRVASVYRFSPALNKDEPVPVWVSFGITFQVREQPRSEVPEVREATPGASPYAVAPKIANPREVVASLERNYPPLLRDAGITGTVMIYLFIDETGAPQDRRIHVSSGHMALDDAALDVSTDMRFEPALDSDDQPVAAWVSLPINFGKAGGF